MLAHEYGNEIVEILGHIKHVLTVWKLMEYSKRYMKHKVSHP